MFRNAISELRLHPSRIVATLIAIAISVAFMAAVSVFMSTEQGGMAKMYVRQMAAADAVVTIKEGVYPDDLDAQLQATLAKVKADPKVEAAEVPTQGYATVSHGGTNVSLSLYGVSSEPFRWAKVTDGAWPTTGTELALPKDVAKKLGVKVGDTLTSGDLTLKLTGITDDPKSALSQFGYIGQFPPEMGGSGFSISIKAKQGVTPAELVSSLQPLVGKDLRVIERAQYEQEQMKQLTGGIDATKIALQVFAAISLLVGMIIIANTFTILITQRRRQIGLLRAVGASTGQIRRQFLAEALIIGIVGSLLGIGLGTGLAAIGNYFTGSLFWGLAFPLGEIIPEFLVGVLITVLAAIVPVWRTSKVKPLEALQPVLSADSQKKVSRVRLVICSIFAALGLGLVVLTFVMDKWQLLPALGAAFLLTFAILGAAPLYVSGLIRLLGKLFGWAGPTARLATSNAARNPQRASATAVALMLAVGLIVTLQVGTSTVRSSINAELDNQFPIDLTVSSFGDAGISSNAQKQIDALPGIKSKVILQGGRLVDESMPGGELAIIGVTPAAHEVAAYVPTDLADDTALVDSSFITSNAPSGTLTVKGASGNVTLKLVATKTGLDGFGNLVVNEATMKKLIAKPVVTDIWLKLTDRSKVADTMAPLETALSGQTQLTVGGGATLAYLIGQVLDVLLLVTTVLLGVAVAIALIGVANTLGLSVIERTRESALLRALGMKRSRLRLMLLIEAIELALVGVVVGVIAGSFFGWFGVSAVMRMAGIGADGVKFGIDWTLTIGLIVIAVVMAALASILPGRRAAMATPTEALAVD